MYKTAILLALLFISQSVTAQAVKFSDGHYENGLTYPIANLGANADVERMLNKNILHIVSNYEDQEFCIGQYGFVQQTNFIQIHFYFNCMDMDESKNEFYLFSLEDGEPCLTSEMFLDKEKKRYLPFFTKRIAAHYTENNKQVPSDEVMQAITIDDCKVQLLEQGIEISRPTDENWPDENLIIYWSELRPFLKTIFI